MKFSPHAASVAGFFLVTGLVVPAFGDTLVISDNFGVGGDSTTTGFVINQGVNQGINPPTATRMTGTTKDNLRHMNRGAGKPDSSFLIDGNRMRINSGAQNGRTSFSEDGVNAFNFGPALGVPA